MVRSGHDYSGCLGEDNALLREGITRLISSDDYFDLVGVASDYPELIELITTHVQTSS